MEVLTSKLMVWSANNLAPHVDTLRVSVTVPSNQRYRVTHIYLRCVRETEATASGWAHASIKVSPGGGTPYHLAMTGFYGTTVNSYSILSQMVDIVLNPGDVLKGNTGDSSTGGTVSYWIAAVYEVIP